jgi:hypothetical protein
MLYASPVRDCDQNISLYREIAAMLHIPPPQVYPATDFSDPWHLNEQGARRNSAEFSALLQKQMAQDPRTSQALASAPALPAQNWK